jgi:hypothetical protein
MKRFTRLEGGMAQLNVSLTTWYKLFPNLKPTNLRCACGREAKNFVPYIRGDFAGIQSAPCECGVAAITRSTPRNAAATEKWEDLLTSHRRHVPEGIIGDDEVDEGFRQRG